MDSAIFCNRRGRTGTFDGMTVKYLAPLLLGTAIILPLPRPGHQSITLGPGGATYTFRDEDGSATILPPTGGPIYDFKLGDGHVVLAPGEAPIFTFGDGEDDE
jgi:hypothetical protein